MPELLNSLIINCHFDIHACFDGRLKGFWDSSKNRWAYENYTAMYNLVYTAIRAVRSDVKIGGPYVPFGNLLPPGAVSPVAGPWGAVNPNSLAAMLYWLRNRVGADFVCLDGHAAKNDSTGQPVGRQIAPW
jgi:hypothetical protein